VTGSVDEYIDKWQGRCIGLWFEWIGSGSFKLVSDLILSIAFSNQIQLISKFC
jgi:hypothetical protein